MSDLNFQIDLDEIKKTLQNYTKGLQDDLVESVEGLATMTHAKTLEFAQDELSSTYKLYADNVEFSNPSDNLWIVSLKKPALWIEEGRQSGFMEELLNGKSGKVSKDGKKYAVIPFEHNKNPTEQSIQAQNIANDIKSFLRKKNINWKKIETGPNGSPRLGRLHTFNINNPRLKQHHKTSPTQGVSIYQTKNSEGKVRRDVVTFRIIHEDHKGEGLWMHPGREGSKLMDKAFEWALGTWEREILPAVMEKHK